MTTKRKVAIGAMSLISIVVLAVVGICIETWRSLDIKWQHVLEGRYELRHQNDA